MKERAIDADRVRHAVLRWLIEAGEIPADTLVSDVSGPILIELRGGMLRVELELRKEK